MRTQFTGNNVEITTALKEFTESKLEKLTKHSTTIQSVHITFDVDKLRQIAEAKLHITSAEIFARAESENMYKTIDLLIEKLIRQLDKHKGKASNH